MRPITVANIKSYVRVLCERFLIKYGAHDGAVTVFVVNTVCAAHSLFAIVKN